MWMMLVVGMLGAGAQEVTPIEPGVAEPPSLTLPPAPSAAMVQARRTRQIGVATFASGAAIAGAAGIGMGIISVSARNDDCFECMGTAFAMVGAGGAAVVGATVALAGGITWGVGAARERELQGSIRISPVVGPGRVGLAGTF